jgi:hypothetical protein
MPCGPVTVGQTQIKNAETGKLLLCKYSDVLADEGGWVAIPDYYPFPYDMMSCRLRDRVNPIPGWWTGKKWTGLRFRQGNVVTHWKRIVTYD